MEGPVLISKLRIPELRPELVSRERLLDKLRSGLSKNLTIVSSPAGFGKTTLISQWVRTTKLPIGWLSLDKDDNDITLFLTYLVETLQQIHESVEDSALSILRSPQPGAVRVALTVILNQMEYIPENYLVVLDDYHLIEDKSVHQAMDFILSHLPSHMHLVLITRADPPLQLARTRGQGLLNEIRMGDLRFTQDEATQFFDRCFTSEMNEEDIIRLARRTEGWIAGLQMAALSMQHRQDVSGFVRSFSGTNRYILEYLLEEVLNQQPKEIQSFLLQTSILERLTGSLCNYVIESDNSEKILNYLERENLFIMHLDEERRWFRYHRLFSDLLQVRLQQNPQYPLIDLHIRASHWYEENDMIPQAIDHSLLAEDFMRAANLMGSEAEEALVRSEVARLLRWGEKLPETIIASHPNLNFILAWGGMMIGNNLDIVKGQMEEIKSDQGWLEGRKETFWAFRSITQLNMEIAKKHANRALELLPKNDSYFRSIAVWVVGISHTSLHSFEEARNALETLLEECRDIGNTFSMVITASQLGRVQMRLGKIAESLETYQQALEVCRDQQGNLLPIASEAMVGLGELYLEMNDLDQAADYLLEGIELSRHWRDAAAMEGYLALALVKQAQSSPEAAQDAIGKSRKLAQDYEVSEIDNRRIELWQAKLWLAQGKLNLVAGWADNLGWKCIKEIEQVKKRDGISFYLFSRESLVVSQLKYLQGEYADALEWLDQQIPMFQTIGRLNALAELHLLKALVHEQMGDKATAITELRTALEIAEPAGFLRIFLDRGIGIKSLLRQAKAQNICQRYIDQILSAFESPIPYNKDEPPPIVEPLSERELEVLRWLQTNLTTPEIADQMMIGVSTVRSHIKNIYSKLVVHKRSEAVNLAKKVGMI